MRQETLTLNHEQIRSDWETNKAEVRQVVDKSQAELAQVKKFGPPKFQKAMVLIENNQD